MNEAEVKKSLDQVSREALSQLEDLDGATGSVLHRLRGKTESAGGIVDAFETRVETVWASAMKSRSEILGKLSRAKIEEARTETALKARRRWLSFLIAYYQYRWIVLRRAAIAGMLFLVYYNWDTIMFWGETIGQVINELLEAPKHQAPSAQKSAPTSDGVGP